MDKSTMNYILGGVTITVIIGGTIYAIKKSKELQELEEQAISVEQAREEVEARRESEPTIVRADQIKRKNIVSYTDGSQEDEIEEITEEDERLTREEIEEIVDDARDEASWNSSFVVDNEDESGFYDDVNFDEPLAETITEEDKVLKFEPNSIKAREQFIKMELAEWLPMEETFQTMLKLFQFPFKPQNDGDHILYTQIMDYRVSFFGESRWSEEVSIADVILHYARATSYNIGETIKYWVGYILEFNEFYEAETSHEIEELIETLLNHKYYNEARDTHGLFGLTRYQLEDAIRVAQGRVDGALTFEIEYNEFLKSCL